MWTTIVDNDCGQQLNNELIVDCNANQTTNDTSSQPSNDTSSQPSNDTTFGTTLQPIETLPEVITESTTPSIPETTTGGKPKESSNGWIIIVVIILIVVILIAIGLYFCLVSKAKKADDGPKPQPTAGPKPQPPVVPIPQPIIGPILTSTDSMTKSEPELQTIRSKFEVSESETQ